MGDPLPAPHRPQVVPDRRSPASRPRPRGRRVGLARGVAGCVLAGAALAGCGGDDPADDAGTGAAGGAGAVAEPELREELLAMQDADQAERTGETGGTWNDRERTERLAEILDEHGWPGHELVGEDGASAAWVVAQHSDLDVEFQRRALDLMREAVEHDDADPTELAYLEDRVALADDGRQVYGTQIGCVDGRAEPAELAEPDRVDELRAEVGLQPLEDYLAELADDCAAEAAQAATPEG